MQIKNTLLRIFSRKNITVAIVGLILLISLLYGANRFFQKYEFVFKAPIVISFQIPISIIQRTMQTLVVQVMSELPLTENEIYLCKTFGDQCKTALEIQRRENVKGDCNAFGINNNGTVDFGYMQVNSVHLSKDITVAQLVDCKSNIDIAYAIYLRDGFTAWTTYKTTQK